MLQNTKAWRIPSSRGKTGTTQKQNLSLAASQAEQLLSARNSMEGRGTEQHKGAFLTLAALWRGAEGCEGSMWDWDAPRILQRVARSCCSPSHTPVPFFCIGSGSAPQKIRIVLTCSFPPFRFHSITLSCPEKSLFTCPPQSLL